MKYKLSEQEKQLQTKSKLEKTLLIGAYSLIAIPIITYASCCIYNECKNYTCITKAPQEIAKAITKSFP